MGTSLPTLANPDLGPRRGRLSDWITQRWVQLTGRRVTLAEHPWLAAPVGEPSGIGPEVFHRHAAREGLILSEAAPIRGLMPDFGVLAGPRFSAEHTHPAVARFYEQTSTYQLDLWSQWRGAFRPFGRLLGLIFSRRLQQLNVPLDPLDTSRGMSSQVLHLQTAEGTHLAATWVRTAATSGDTIYAGCYATGPVPGFPGTCVKVAFPLPNGFALVVMKPEAGPGGSLRLRSHGRTFGDPGFYFYVEETPGRGWARYVAALKEEIHVYEDDRGVLRADHRLDLGGLPFLQLHYRMTPAPGAPPAP